MIPIAIHVDESPAALAAQAALRRPALVAPAPRQVSFGTVSGRVFAGTRQVRVYVDGNLTRARDVGGATRFRFSLDLPPRDVRIRVVAVDARGRRAARGVGPVYGLPGAALPSNYPPGALDPGLQRRVRRIARAYPGIAAAFVQNLRTGRGAAWNARARFPAASTLKLAIAMEVLRRLRGQPAPSSWLHQQLWSMLVYSDNASANRLLVWLGGSTSGGASHVNALMRSLWIRDSLMYGGYEVLAARRRPIPIRVNEQPAFGVGKYTTAWDLARLHRSVHQAARGLGPLAKVDGSFGRRDARYLLWLLAHVTDHGKLDRFLPGSTSVLHKAGWITYARHDAGLVYWRRGVYVVSVMTWNSGGVGLSSDVLAGRIARTAFDRFRQHREASAASDDTILVSA